MKAEDSGNYSCTASNSWGSDEITLNLQVQGEQQRLWGTSRFTPEAFELLLCPQFPPISLASPLPRPPAHQSRCHGYLETMAGAPSEVSDGRHPGPRGHQVHVTCACITSVLMQSPVSSSAPSPWSFSMAPPPNHGASSPRVGLFPRSHHPPSSMHVRAHTHTPELVSVFSLEPLVILIIHVGRVGRVGHDGRGCSYSAVITQ